MPQVSQCEPLDFLQKLILKSQVYREGRPFSKLKITVDRIVTSADDQYWRIEHVTPTSQNARYICFIF